MATNGLLFVIQSQVSAYFEDIQLCLNTSNYTISRQRLAIIARCTISLLAFTMAVKVITRASKWVVGGERLPTAPGYLQSALPCMP